MTSMNKCPTLYCNWNNFQNLNIKGVNGVNMTELIISENK